MIGRYPGSSGCWPGEFFEETIEVGRGFDRKQCRHALECRLLIAFGFLRG